MEIIEVKPTKCVNLYILGDTHFPRGKKNKFQEVIDVILKDKDGYMIGLGDWIEAIKYGDPRYDPEEIAASILEYGGEINMINEQWRQFEDMIKPLVQKNKILGLHQGNHEYQFTKRNSFNGLKAMCNRLNIKYLDYLPAIWRFKYKNKELKIMTLHGVGSGIGEGYEIKQLDKHARLFDDIDIIAEGHTHKLSISTTSDRLKITDDNQLKQNKQWRCACGSFLGNYDIGKASYSQRALYKPLPLGYVKISIQDGNIISVNAVPV
jgi:predicted phosphodiesterase